MALKTNKKDDDPEELLRLMSAKRDDPKRAEQAFAKFFYLFYAYILKIVFNWSKNERHDEDALKTKVNDTMLKIYESASRYKPDATAQTPEERMKHVKAWCGIITEHVVKDQYRKKKAQMNYELELVEMNAEHLWLMDEAAGYYQSHPELHVHAEAFLKSNKASHTEAYRCTITMSDKYGNIPDEVAKNFEEKDGLTRSNLRTIKSRMNDKFITYLSKLPQFKYLKNHNNENTESPTTKSERRSAGNLHADDGKDDSDHKEAG